MLDGAQRTSAKKERASGRHRELVAILFETGRFWGRAMKIFAFEELTYPGLPLKLGPEVPLTNRYCLPPLAKHHKEYLEGDRLTLFD
jgi:hypothetical protein